MKNFSEVVKCVLVSKSIDIPTFAEKMGFSVQYIYDLLSGRNGRRWNSDSIERACNFLGIEIQFNIKRGENIET
jgi:hypothetical protein